MSATARTSSARQASALETRTPAALAAIAKKFAPVVLQDDSTPVPPSNADYFSRMMLPTNIELDSGNYAVYDVQPDFRFIMNYILYHIIALYPEMNIKGHPYVTPLSLAGYCFDIVYAHLLNCDATFRPTKSWQCARLMSNSDLKDYNDCLLRARVPTFLSDLLIEMSPVYDPRRNNHLFVPSLAGYSHLHDYGRTILPMSFYSAHNLLAATRTNKDPDDVLDDFFALTVLNYGTRDFSNSMYFGTWYSDQHHPNPVNQDLLSFFNPLVGRALSARPTFARLPLEAPTTPDDNTFNIYETALLSDDQNIGLKTTTIDAISAFILSDSSSSPALGSVLATLSGTLLLSHSIEPPTLPTWTGQKHVSSTDPTVITDSKFATDHHFMAKHKSGKTNVPFLKDNTDLQSNMYLLQDGKYDANKAPIAQLVFSNKQSVLPNVMYFQPYDVSPASLGLTIACGIKIELAEIDGFTIPSEHPEDSLDDNNSQYLQSAVRMSLIHPIFSQDTPADHPLRLTQRSTIDRTQQAIAVAFRTMTKAVLPFFANQGVKASVPNPTTKTGITVETGHDDPQAAFTFHAGTNGNTNVPDHHYYAWSSYRVVHKYKAPAPSDISMILSFRPHYGLNVTLSRSKHPFQMIPH